jgi:hypothetical protein
VQKKHARTASRDVVALRLRRHGRTSPERIPMTGPYGEAPSAAVPAGTGWAATEILFGPFNSGSDPRV